MSFIGKREALVRQIDALTGDDPEADHGLVDQWLLSYAGPEVKAAVERLEARARWWATA